MTARTRSVEQKANTMPRGKKTPAPVATLPDIKIGDRVVITQEGSTKGQHAEVVEVNHKNNRVRLTAFGWHERSDVEVLDDAPDAAAQAAAQAEAETRRTDVDGEPAKLVLDGMTGAPADDEPMIKPPLEDLIRALTRAKDELAEATIVKQRGNERHKDALGAYNAIADEIVQHYGRVEQLGFSLGSSNGATGAQASVDGEDDEEEEDFEPAVRRDSHDFSGPE